MAMDAETDIWIILAGMLAGGLVCCFIAARSAWRTRAASGSGDDMTDDSGARRA